MTKTITVEILADALRAQSDLEVVIVENTNFVNWKLLETDLADGKVCENDDDTNNLENTLPVEENAVSDPPVQTDDVAGELDDPHLSNAVAEIKRAALEEEARWLGEGGGYVATQVNALMDDPHNQWSTVRFNLRALARNWSCVNTQNLTTAILVTLQREDLGLHSEPEVRRLLRKCSHYQMRCFLWRSKLSHYSIINRGWGSHPDFQ